MPGPMLPSSFVILSEAGFLFWGFGSWPLAKALWHMHNDGLKPAGIHDVSMAERVCVGGGGVMVYVNFHLGMKSGGAGQVWLKD